MSILGCSSTAAKGTVFPISLVAAHICESFLAELICPLSEQLYGCQRCRIHEAFQSQKKDGYDVKQSSLLKKPEQEACCISWLARSDACVVQPLLPSVSHCCCTFIFSHYCFNTLPYAQITSTRAYRQFLEKQLCTRRQNNDSPWHAENKHQDLARARCDRRRAVQQKSRGLSLFAE
jgi:hypothetical protein